MGKKVKIAMNFADYHESTDHLGYEVTIGSLDKEQLKEIKSILETNDLEKYYESDYFQQFYNYNDIYHGNGIVGGFAGLTSSGIESLNYDDKDNLSTDNWEFDTESPTDTEDIIIEEDIILVTFQAEDKYFCVEQEIEGDNSNENVQVQLCVDYIDRLTAVDWDYLEEDVDQKPYSVLRGVKSKYGKFHEDFDYWDGDENKYVKYQFILNGDQTVLAISNRGQKMWNGNTNILACEPFGYGELCMSNYDYDLIEKFAKEIGKAVEQIENEKTVETKEQSEVADKQNKIKKAWDEDGKSLSKLIEKYNYQPKLTKKLDNINDGIIDEKTMLEIFLWKTDRYPDLEKIDFIKLNSLNNIKPENFKECEEVLRDLISIKGFGLAMASTILRFRNPDVFPIIDRRAYRAIMDEDKLSVYHSTPIEKQIEIYFNYVEKVHEFVKEKGVDLSIVDRVLYIFDKETNKYTKI